MSNLIELLESVNGSTFISINTEVTPMMNKTTAGKGTPANPHLGRVKKVTVGRSVMVFQNKNVNGYQQMVMRRLEKEGKNAKDFELGHRVWGTRLPELPVVEHKGTLYLEVIVLKPGNVFYTLDGKPTPLDQLIGVRQHADDMEQGGLDDKVIMRTIAFESITAITINKVTHTIS